MSGRVDVGMRRRVVGMVESRRAPSRGCERVGLGRQHSLGDRRHGHFAFTRQDCLAAAIILAAPPIRRANPADAQLHKPCRPNSGESRPSPPPYLLVHSPPACFQPQHHAPPPARLLVRPGPQWWLTRSSPASSSASSRPCRWATGRLRSPRSTGRFLLATTRPFTFTGPTTSSASPSTGPSSCSAAYT